MITVLGGVFLAAAIATVLARRPRGIVVLLAISIAFPHSAGILLGSASISCFHMMAAIAMVRLAWLLRLPEVRQGFMTRSARPVLILLGVLLLYGLLVTAIGPAVFGGTPVYAARGGIDQQAIARTPLHYTVSNVAQVLYLVLDLGATLLVAIERPLGDRLFELGIASGSILGLVRGLLPPTLTDPLLDTMTNVSYFTAAEDPRLRGTFSEASLFGLFLLTSLAYLVAAVPAARGGRLVRLLVLSAITVVDLLLNRSGTVLLALPLTAAAAAAVALWTWVRRGRPLVRAPVAGAVVVGVAAVVLSPIGGLLTGSISGKTETGSFANRTAADASALALLVHTFGLGAGLGSNRSSSLFPTLLSTVGVVGTAALVGALVVLLAERLRRRRSDAVAWALIGALAAYATSVPDLSFPVLWVLGGLLLADLLPTRPLPPPRPGRGRHRLRAAA